MSRSDAERVADILDSCRRLNEIASAGKDEFFAGEILQDAASYRLTVVGEALNSLSKDFAMQHPGLRIPEARGMRNRLSHEYYDIDLDVLRGPGRITKERAPTSRHSPRHSLAGRS